jgi:hypothetical protein
MATQEALVMAGEDDTAGEGRSTRLSELQSRLDAVGLEPDSLLAGPLDLMRQATLVVREVRAHHRAARSATDVARARFEAGEISLMELHQHASLAAALQDRQSVVARSLRGRVAAAMAEVDSSLPDVVDGAVWPALRARTDAVVAEVTSLAGGLPRRVANRESAVRAGAVDTWNRLGVLADEFADLHACRGWLVGTGLLFGFEWLSAGEVMGPQDDPLPGNIRRVLPLWVQAARPDKLPTEIFTDVAPELRLVTAIQVGAGPGMYDGETARVSYRTWLEHVLKLGRQAGLGPMPLTLSDT